MYRTQLTRRVGTPRLCPAPHTAASALQLGQLVPGVPFPQVGAIGDEEEWVSLYEEDNEPDAQTLEIPNLTPYTHYR